jgi:N-acetyl-gamma-glutamyl-phosphate reductase
MQVGIVGASGYTGAELIRLLHLHPRAELSYLTAHTYAGKTVGELYPHLLPYAEMRFADFAAGEALEQAEVFFICLPHGEAMQAVPQLIDGGAKVIDLSADFRLDSAAQYQEWYGLEHSAAAFLEEAVYGLPEVNRAAIAEARLVAVPGCYPTASTLALAPLLQAGWLAGGVVLIDAKSGVSGAGRGLSLDTHYPQCDASVKPYNVLRHRHIPEMEQEMAKLAQEPVRAVFTPQLVPMSRGILSTTYALLRAGAREQLWERYEETYANEPFVRLLPEGEWPQTKAVSGSNYCQVGVTVDERSGWMVAAAAIDNLVKGASGQAVQCFNLVMGLEETMGLEGLALFP